MASGKQWQEKTFVGAATAITVYFDFVPARIELYTVAGGAAIEVGYKSNKMLTDSYYSTSTGIDAGVTINSDGSVTIANGADINVSTVTTYCVAYA